MPLLTCRQTFRAYSLQEFPEELKAGTITFPDTLHISQYSFLLKLIQHNLSPMPRMLWFTLIFFLIKSSAKGEPTESDLFSKTALVTACSHWLHNRLLSCSTGSANTSQKSLLKTHFGVIPDLSARACTK